MPKREIQRLVFVFDADSGLVGAVVDSAKKMLTIKGCALCSITHGVLGEKKDWKSCKEELGVPIDYMHRDEVPAALRELVIDRLPCIVAEVGNEAILLVAPDVLERCKGSVADLKGRIRFYATANNLLLAEPQGG